VIKLDEDVEKNDDRDAATVFFAVDMRDQSVQEVRINNESWAYKAGVSHGSEYLCSLTKYKENQMIKYGPIDNGRFAMSLITIESFQRISFC